MMRSLLSITIVAIQLLNLQWVSAKTKKYWLPKLHKRPYKSRFIANSSSCTTTELSKLMTSCFTAVNNHLIKYYDTCYERDGINRFWSIKDFNEILNNLKSKGFKASTSTLSTYDFSRLYTTLPHHLIKDKLIDLIEHTFSREKALYLACNNQRAFFTSDVYKIIIYGLVKKFVRPLFIFWKILLLYFPQTVFVGGWGRVYWFCPSVRLSFRPSASFLFLLNIFNRQ